MAHVHQATVPSLMEAYDPEHYRAARRLSLVASRESLLLKRLPVIKEASFMFMPGGKCIIYQSH